MGYFRSVALILILLIFFPGFALSGDDRFTIVEENNKKGLLDSKGNIAIPVMYDDLGWSKGAPAAVNEVIGFKKGSLWGLISVKNHKIVEPVFAAVYPAGDAFVASKFSPYSNEVKYGLVSGSGKTLVSFKYYTLDYDGSCFIASLKRDSLFFGIIDSKDKPILPVQYKNVVRIEQNLYAITDHDNKQAYFNLKNKWVSPFIYDAIYAHNHRLLIVVKNGKSGIMDAEGRTLVKPVYKDITFSGGSVGALPFNQWDLLGSDNGKKGSFQFDRIVPVGEKVYKATAGKSEVLIDDKGQFLFQPGNYSIRDFRNGLALIQRDGKYGVLQQDGAIVLQPEYDSLVISGKFLLAGKYDKRSLNWSLLNLSGKAVTGPGYHEIKPLNEKLFAVRIDQYWGLIDSAGNSIATCKFDDLQLIDDNLIRARFVNHEGALGQDGEWAIPPKKGKMVYLSSESYMISEDFCRFAVYHKNQLAYCTSNQLLERTHDLLEVRNDGKTGLLSLHGKILLNPVYDFISELQSDSIYVFGKDSLYGIMTQSGRMLANGLAFEAIYPLKDDYMGVRLSGRYGFVDVNGKLRIANRYDSIRMFNDGFAAIKLVGRWGYIDKMEHLKVQPRYDEAYDFMNGVAIVKKGEKCGIVNKDDRLVLQMEFDRLRRLDNGRFVSIKDGKYGLIGTDGKELVFPKYEEIRDLENGFIIIRRKDKYGMATADGELIIPIIYDELIYDRFNDLYLGRKSPEWENFDLL